MLTVDALLSRLSARAETVRKHRRRMERDDAAAVRSVLRVLADGRPHVRREVMHRTNIVRAARLDAVIALLGDRVVVTRGRLHASWHGGRLGTYYALAPITGDGPAT